MSCLDPKAAGRYMPAGLLRAAPSATRPANCRFVYRLASAKPHHSRRAPSLTIPPARPGGHRKSRALLR